MSQSWLKEHEHVCKGHGVVGVEVLVSAHNKDWLLVRESAHDVRGRGSGCVCTFEHDRGYKNLCVCVRAKWHIFIHFVCGNKPACDCLASLCAGPDPRRCMVNRNVFPGRRNFPQQPPIAVMVVVMSCSCQSSFRLSSLIHVPAAQHLQLEQMFTPMKTRQTRPARLSS